MTEPVAALPRRERRRRPSGEAPPLPRAVSRSTRAFFVLGIATVAFWAALQQTSVVRAVTAADHSLLSLLARVRSEALTDVMKALDALGSPWVFRATIWAALVVLLVVRRFQHLITALAVVLAVGAIDAGAETWVGRMRPTDPSVLGSWEGFAHPSRPVAGLGLATAVVLYTLVPAGRARRRAAYGAIAAVAALVTARLYLSVDHPSDVGVALVMGMAVPSAVFRVATPDDVFPVRFRPGTRAHLDVGGRRRDAILAALSHQAGIRASRIEPFALSGSAGSTPLRVEAEGRRIFGKLYAVSHLRSDRLYKLVRTVLYGRLEDERPFNAVRRLVEHEDHMLRVMQDAGLPTPEPLGFVEITPEREYLLVTEFLEGASQINEAEVTDDVIDQGLAIVRRMWHAGLAHRDIKSANLLVRHGRLFIIDVAFAAARPSPWRQAVDLANMMMTLALCADAERVYRRALELFTADEVAEAFAASRSVTIPSQLRAALRADGRDLQAQLRALAPERPPVSIQRWSLRRVGLTLGLAVSMFLVVALLGANLQQAGLL